MRSGRKKAPLFAAALVCIVLSSGCVTRTERIYPHERIPEDESIWEELQREFGWRKDNANAPNEIPTEPFYKRAAESISGWFRDDSPSLREEDVIADRQRFEEKREEARRRLQQQQELDQLLGDDE